MSEHTVEGPTVKRLERSRSDRMLAGVSGGLASYFEIHPAFYRVGFVVLTLLGGAGIVIYARGSARHARRGQGGLGRHRGAPRRGATGRGRSSGSRSSPSAVPSLLSNATLWPHGDAWFVLLLAGAAILWITRHSATGGATDATELARRGLAPDPALLHRNRDRDRIADRACLLCRPPSSPRSSMCTSAAGSATGTVPGRRPAGPPRHLPARHRRHEGSTSATSQPAGGQDDGQGVGWTWGNLDVLVPLKCGLCRQRLTRRYGNVDRPVDSTGGHDVDQSVQGKGRADTRPRYARGGQEPLDT